MVLKAAALTFFSVYCSGLGLLGWFYLPDGVRWVLPYLSGTGPLVYLPLTILAFSGILLYLPLMKVAASTQTVSGLSIIGPLLFGTPTVIALIILFYFGPRIADGFTAGSFVLADAIGSITGPFILRAEGR